MSEEEKWPDIDPTYHPVVETYGREMFTLVFNAGMGSQATQALISVAQALGRSQLGRNQELAGQVQHAVMVLAGAFNEASTRLARAQGWTGAQLEECERAIEQAMQAKIAVAPKIVLH